MGAVAFPLLLIGALARLGGYVSAPARPEAPLVVELVPATLPPPDLPEPDPPHTSPDRIVSPPPIIRLPSPAPLLATQAEPSPQPRPVQREEAAPAQAAPAPAVRGTPAPIVPPDGYAESLDNSTPRYPLESRRRREQGTVILAVEVTAEGQVAAIHVSRSSGHKRLDEEALQTVRRWRFRPATQTGKPAAARGYVEIPFVLNLRQR